MHQGTYNLKVCFDGWFSEASDQLWIMTSLNPGFCHRIKDIELFLIWNILAVRVGGKKPWKIPGEDHFSGMLDIVLIRKELE
jgi:hypothetical protein